MRSWRLAPVFLLLLPLQACSVRSGGYAGIGVDGRGGFVGYFRVCAGQLDGATLSTQARPYEESAVDVGSWSVAPPVKDFSRWSLVAPRNGWATLRPLAPLTAGADYHLHGWTHDDSWSAVDATFTLSDVAKLAPGQVMYSSGTVDAKRVRDVPAVANERDFRRRSCPE